MGSASSSLAFGLLLSAMVGCAARTPDAPTAEVTPTDSAATARAAASTAAPTALPVASASSPPPAAEPAPFADTLGGVAPGVPQDELERRFGKPKSKSRLQEEQATGEFASSFTWADGLSAIMTATSAKGRLEARLLVVEAPSKLVTSRGIGVGSTRAEVKAAYAKEIDEQVSTDEMVVVGEMLGGLRVHFDKQQRVRSLALGSDGE